MDICVLGGSGFVGSELVARLAQAGHRVRVPTRAAGHAERLAVLERAEVMRANVHDPATLASVLAGCDAAVNLVGILNPAGRSTFEATHTALAAKLFAAARRAGVHHVLQMSALGAAPDAPSRYLRSRWAAEQALRAPAPLPGAARADGHAHADGASPAVTVLRPSVIFGARDTLTNRFARLLRLGGGFMPLARADARFAPVSVRDVAAAALRALTDPAVRGGTYELCGPEVVTLEELVRLTARVAGLPCRIVKLPDAAGWLQGAVLGLLPGKPFTLDNFRSLSVDCVCRQDGCAALGITARPMMAELPLYLAPAMPAARTP